MTTTEARTSGNAHPITLVRQAIAWAKRNHISVTLDGAVSPLDVVLIERGILVEEEGFDAALVKALDATPEYVAGLRCGLYHTAPDGSYVRGPKVRFYLVGMEHGARLRYEIKHEGLAS